MSGICIYAEQYDNQVENSAYELVTAARELAAHSGETITALVLGEDPEALARQLSFHDVRVAAVKTGISAFQDDALCVCAAEAPDGAAAGLCADPGQPHLPGPVLPGGGAAGYGLDSGLFHPVL